MVDPKQTPTSGSAISTRVKKLDFPPFIKDLFLGRFNKSVLNFPEVLNYERHKQLEDSVNHFSEYLDTRSESLSQVSFKRELPPEIIHWCKSEKLYGLSLPRELGGQDLMSTEIARIFEELGEREVSLSEYLFVNEFLGLKIILDYGSDEQKSKYLPLLTTGDSQAAFCLNEQSSGSDPSSILTRALKHEDTPHIYTLEGKKTWVANASSANVFIVFAQTYVKNYLKEEEKQLTAFIIDKETEGVSVSKPYTVNGYAGLQFSDVTFNCQVPENCVLGTIGQGLHLIQGVLHQNKFLMAAGVITSLKGLLNETIEHCNTRKQFGLSLSKFSLVKIQLAKMAGKLYCLESMLYMTSGLHDMSECPDVEVESVIVKQYAAETSDYIVKTCLSLLGSKTLLDENDYTKYLDQNQFLQGWQGSANILKCFIGITGILHIVETLGPALMKPLNPLFHPIAAAKWKRHSNQHQKNSAPLTHKLQDCVHPRLISSADRVEWVVEKIPFLASNLVLKCGEQLQIPETNLVKLADIVIETYAMTCALSRSNRSYIVGNLHAEHEINLAIPYIAENRLKCEQLFLELQNWEHKKKTNREQLDAMEVQTGLFLSERGYRCIAHPLKQTSVC